MPQPPILSITRLTKRYGGITALDGLTLQVRPGEIYAFLGPNGAGKTTTIRILNGLTAPTSGAASVDDIDIAEQPLAAKRLCGIAPQNLNLDGDLTVAENLDFHGRLYSMSRSERRERARELLRYVDLHERSGSLARTLSGGMKRRLMLARALLHRPRLVFLDEPTAGLDPAIRRKLWNLIKRVQADGVAVFMTTHYIEEAQFLADRVGLLDRGRLAAEGTPEELMARLGEWAVDKVGTDELETSYHRTRQEAGDCIARSEAACTLRRVNLEDAFLALTGKRVADHNGEAG